MAKSLVLAHWSKQFDSFATSTQEFYAAVEQGLKVREIPSLRIGRTLWKESGALSPKREYLRAQRGHLRFDLCAAPFGRGYFFSWWQTDECRFGWLYTLGFLLLTAALFTVLFLRPELYFHRKHFWQLFVPLVPVLFLVAGALVRVEILGRSHDAKRAPLFGWLYTRVFAPDTYFEIDTIQMYQSMFQSAVLEAIDALTSAKGVRALTEDERKPISRDFFKK